jgi:prepilin-type N-terminal cleavage/methylation domain-containing protein
MALNQEVLDMNGKTHKKGFTLLEVMVVVIIIGILSTLAYSNITEMIFTNRSKETAQTIRTFIEKSLLDAKRQNKEVRIYINGNAIIASEIGTNGKEISREALSQGFSGSNDPPPDNKKEFENDVKSEIRIGTSGISKDGYFAACFKTCYCGGAVKLSTENSLKAYIKKGCKWEAL